MANVLSGVIFGVGADVEIIVVTTVAIDLEFAVTALYDVDVLSDVLTALEFVVLALLEESKFFC